MPRRRPRKIIIWRYDDDAGTTMDIPVYQLTGHDGIWLRVNIPELDIREENSDINLLRERVFAAIKDRLVLKWEPCLQISVSGRAWSLDDFAEAMQINPSLSCEIEVRVSRIEIATRPDGSQCYREPGLDSRIHEGLPGPGDGIVDDEQQDTRSRVPDTRENRQALVELGHAFVRLGRELCDRLGPDQVNAAVSRLLAEKTLAGLPALPPAGGGKKGDSPCPTRRRG
jgi:hypothetical protein